jgi:SCY1-like protein 1
MTFYSLQTKHPRVLRFEWAGETESGGKITFYVVTECVSPLPTVLEELNLSGDQRDMYLSLGLRQVAEAVAFLNNQCKIVHGNVCWHTVLVTEDLDWRLGFMDVSTEYSSLSSSLLVRCVSNGNRSIASLRIGRLVRSKLN